MAKLTLQFGENVLKEVAIGPNGVRIGRLPDNPIMIDNPAISSRHARVYPEGGAYVVEDLDSTNGTFINDERITRKQLQHGDVIIVGKHKIVFDQHSTDAPSVEEPADGGGSDLDGGTVYLDTKKQRELLAKISQAASQAAGPRTAKVQIPGTGPTQVTGAAAPATSSGAARVGVLRVIAGKTDKQEYTLEAQTSQIGKADTNAIRLKGWFKPKVAVSISRKGESYTASKIGGSPTVNDQALTGRHELKEGDIIKVSGLALEFRLQ